MFTKIGTITIGVSDQDKALDFYVHKLGFEKVNSKHLSLIHLEMLRPTKWRDRFLIPVEE